jgi:hypothetical protein
MSNLSTIWIVIFTNESCRVVSWKLLLLQKEVHHYHKKYDI